jgi:hypothetical protein
MLDGMLQKVKKGDLALGAPARMFALEFPPARGDDAQDVGLCG